MSRFTSNPPMNHGANDSQGVVQQEKYGARLALWKLGRSKTRAHNHTERHRSLASIEG